MCCGRCPPAAAFHDGAEAPKIANGTPDGLGTGVSSHDGSRARRMRRETRKAKLDRDQQAENQLVRDRRKAPGVV